VHEISGAPLRAEPCPVCDAESALPRFRIEGFDAPIAVCEGCGLGRYVPMPSEDEIAALYPSDYYGQPGEKFRPLIEWLVRAVASRHIRFLCAGLPRGARVLDVGCGRGVILGPLADRGYEAHGMEVSADAVRGADSRAKIRIAPTLAAADYDAESLDQIVIWHVLEHLRDPRATIEECFRILKPRGRLIVAVPNFSSWQARWTGEGWFHLDPPRHLYQFPLAALRRMLEREGFECGSSYHFSLRQNPFGWIQSVLNRIRPEHPNHLYTVLQTSGAGGKLPFGERIGALALLALGTLPALAMSVAEAVLGSGATVHVVATRPEAASGAGSSERGAVPGAP
jgi:SAM-dependent methyltransferase